MRYRSIVLLFVATAHCATFSAPLANTRDSMGVCRDSAGRFATDASCSTGGGDGLAVLGAVGGLLGLAGIIALIGVASRPSVPQQPPVSGPVALPPPPPPPPQPTMRCFDANGRAVLLFVRDCGAAGHFSTPPVRR